MAFGSRTISRGKPIFRTLSNKGLIGHIDIKINDYFFELRPWRDGKLITLDGWGCYAEMSFKDKNKIILKPLVDFPRAQQDIWTLTTWPEAGVITSTSGKMAHIASIDDGITKSHIPMLTWVHRDPKLILLDPNEGLIAHQYSLNRNRTDVGVSNYIYNYKTDTFVYKTPDLNNENQHEHAVFMSIVMDDQYILSYMQYYDEQDLDRYDYFLYDWRNGKKIRNDLTETLNKNNSYIYKQNNINLNRRVLFAYNSEDRRNRKLIKISWDENYSNVQVADMSNLLQEIYKKYSISPLNILISSDGSWVTAQVTDLSDWNPNADNRGFIDTRIFFHIDNKYPNGISMPVFIDSEETRDNTNNEDGVFVQHPVYGMCYAQKWQIKRKNYLRLYKMDDVLTVINSGNQSMPFNYDDSKNFLFTRFYSYKKEFIKGWVFEEADTDIEVNEFIDSLIEYIEEEIRKVPTSRPDYQLSKIELYKDNRFLALLHDNNAILDLYIHRANEYNNIYYIEIEYFVLEPGYSTPHFIKHKLIICNQYFNFSESDHDVQKHMFWEFYDLLGEGESAYKLFLNEIEKHRR
jgi:hypothetical protein